MAEKNWEVMKVRYCDHVDHEVSIETEVVYPSDYLPDMPRVVSHRCSDAEACNLVDKPSCAWCGTHPNHQPL